MEGDTGLSDRTKKPEHVEDEAEDQGDTETEAYENNIHKHPRNPASTGTETRMLQAMESWRRKKGLVGQDLDGMDWAGINWTEIDDQQAEDLIDERDKTGDPGTPSLLVLAD